jgi:hypothetical protein
VKSREELEKFRAENSGKRPVFISHNYYTAVYPSSGAPCEVYLDKLFFDFDAEDKPENAQLDLIKLMDWCDENNLPILTVFSGGKGFHAYIALKPERYMIGDTLWMSTKAIHAWLCEKLDLYKTKDRAIEEPVRLCRVINTPHVKIDRKTGKAIINGRYCCALKHEWVRNWHISEILEYAKHPDFSMYYEPEGDLYTFYDFMDHFGITIEDAKRIIVKSMVAGEIKTDYKPITDEELKEIACDCPCIQNEIFNNRNPIHKARFSLVCWLRDHDYSYNFTYNLIKDRKYIDWDREITEYQINHIIGKGYHMPSCSTLLFYGLCVGKQCPKFEKSFKAAV